MIKIKLAELLGKHKMTRKRLAELIKVRPNTIGDLYNEKVKKIDITLLDNICKTLNCEVCDVLAFVDEEESK